MKYIKFKKFLKNNTLELAILPEPIREKAHIFERLYEILGDEKDPDYKQLLEQLEILDLEILQDIEQHHEDRLEHNEPLEILVKPARVSKTIQKKATKRLTTDESILEELTNMGRHRNIGRSTLRDLGFKKNLKNSLVVGNYALRRSSIFFHRYDIVALKKAKNS